MKNRIVWLDMFRGLSAIMIVLYHYHDYVGFRSFKFGFLAVDGFFVLSGIVLARKYADAIVEGKSFRSFAAARLMRLYPMAFIAASFVVLLNVVDAPPNPWMWPGRNDVWTMFLVLVPSVGGLTASTDAAFPPDIPLWSLWAELVANGVWFAVLRAGVRWMPWLAGLSMAILVAFAWQLGSMNVGWENSISIRVFTLARALAWFSVGYFIARTDVKPPVSPLVLTVALGGVFVAFLSGMTVSWIMQLATVALAAALLHALLDAPQPNAAVSKIASLLGLMSFPLYLIHAPAGRLLAFFNDGMPHAIVLLLLLLPLAAAATWLNEWVVGLLHRRWQASRSQVG